MTTGAARVVMFSQRNLYELEVWRSGLREFEELIRGFDAVDLVAPHRGRWFAQRKRLALRVGRATDVVLSVGRRSQDVHQALLSLAREGKIFYVYDTLTNLHTDDIDGHRFLVTNLLKRSKYFVVHPAKWDRPDERGEQSEIGSRYFEGAAAGTIMIGTPPTTPEFARVLPWPEAVVPLPSDADGVAQRLRQLEQQPERQQHIRRTNA